jgi:hypothetical protein
MSRPDPRMLPTAPGLRLPRSSADEPVTHGDHANHDRTLWRLFGAAALAIVALALATALIA